MSRANATYRHFAAKSILPEPDGEKKNVLQKNCLAAPENMIVNSIPHLERLGT